MGATIDYGNGAHDLVGAYRLQNDGGQWFVMGNNMSVPCADLDQAVEIYKQLTGRDYFEQGAEQSAGTGDRTQAPSSTGIGRSAYKT